MPSDDHGGNAEGKLYSPGMRDAIKNAEAERVDISMPSGPLTVTNGAATNYANVTRAQYDDWLERFYPKQKELMESTQNGTLLNEQLARVDSNFASASKSAQQANQNHLGRFGLAASESSSAQAKSALANVTSKNALRENEKERAMSVLSGAGKSNLEQLQVS